MGISRAPVTYLPIVEFQAIRIACAHAGCRGVIELPPDKVEEVLKRTSACCPLCEKPFTHQKVENGSDMVTVFAKAIMALAKLHSQCRVELPLKEPVELPSPGK